MSRIVYADAMMCSVHLMMAFGARVTPEQIRQWGRRGLVSRLPSGKCRYNLAEVESYARDKGHLAPSWPDQARHAG